VRNAKGEVVGLRLPTKTVMIANHQVCDNLLLLIFPTDES
jgi:hypothetical protein